MRFVCNLRMREVTKCKMLIQMCSQTDTLLIAGGQTRPKNWHLPTSCPLLPCWQGRDTLITLDGTLELRAAWNNWDIQTPSCPRLQMLTWECGQGDSGQGRTSCPELSWAESGEWRVWFIVPECQLNVNLQTSSRSWAQEQEPAECGEHFCFHLVSCPAGRYRYCPASHFPVSLLPTSC